MRKYNHFYLTLLSIFFVFGLAGCGQSHSSKDSSEAAKWGVGKQWLVRNGAEPVSLHGAENTFENFFISDEITFSQQPAGTSVQITTECFHDKNKLGPHQFAAPMKERFFIYELLPKIAIFNTFASEENPVKCSIGWLVKNPRGDTHRFKLSTSPVLISGTNNSLAIFKSKIPIATNTAMMPSTLPEVLVEELPLYTLPALSSKQLRYDLECTTLTASLRGDLRSPRMDEFEFVNRAPAPGSETPTWHRPELCRIFSIREPGKIENMTEPFILRYPGPRPLITLSSSPLILHGTTSPHGQISIGTYMVRNPTQEPLVLAIPIDSSNHLDFIVVARTNPRAPLEGMALAVPPRVAVSGATSFAYENQIRFVVPPLRTVTVELSLQYTQLKCPGRELRGIFYRVPDAKGLRLHVMDGERSPAELIHVLSTIPIESPFERYAYMLLLQRGTGVDFDRYVEPQPKPTMPTVTQFVPGMCNLNWTP